MKFSNLRRKFIKKATYTTPLLLSLGSLTKPQVAGGSHLAIPPIQIPNTFRRNSFNAANRNSGNYNPLFNPVDNWQGTTRFWGGGLYRIGEGRLYAREYYDFNADEEAEYLDIYGFAKIHYNLPEPRKYQDYRSLRRLSGLTDDRELTRGEYLLTRSFERDRAKFQATRFWRIIQYGRHSAARRMMGLADTNDIGQLAAHYELAAYNHYTREVLGHEFDLVSLEQAREWSAGRDVDPVIKDRMDKLNTYNEKQYRKTAGYSIIGYTIEDLLVRIRENDECQSIDDVFAQQCGKFDPYGRFDAKFELWEAIVGPYNPSFPPLSFYHEECQTVDDVYAQRCGRFHPDSKRFY